MYTWSVCVCVCASPQKKISTYELLSSKLSALQIALDTDECFGHISFQPAISRHTTPHIQCNVFIQASAHTLSGRSDSTVSCESIPQSDPHVCTICIHLVDVSSSHGTLLSKMP